MESMKESTDIKKSFLIHKLHCSKYLLRNVSLIICLALFKSRPSQVVRMVNNLPAVWETWVGKIPLDKGLASNLSILAWRTPWKEEPGWLEFKGWQRVRHD